MKYTQQCISPFKDKPEFGTPQIMAMTKSGVQWAQDRLYQSFVTNTQSLDTKDVVLADKTGRQEMNLLPNAASYL